MSKDQAARIALREYDLDAETVARNNLPCCSLCRKLERAIRRAIASAVRKERERCVTCAVEIKTRELDNGSSMIGVWCTEDIIKAINGGKR